MTLQYITVACLRFTEWNFHQKEVSVLYKIHLYVYKNQNNEQNVFNVD